MNNQLNISYLVIVGIMSALSYGHMNAQSKPRISFEGVTCQIQEAFYKGFSGLNDLPEVQFFNEHFAQTDYEAYRGYYCSRQCLIPEEDFRSWRGYIENNTIEVLGVVRLESTQRDFSIVQYKMGSDGVYRYFPFAIERIGNDWCLFDLELSERLMDVKVFFAYVRAAEVENMKSSTFYTDPLFSSYVGTGGVINGEALLERYSDRYEQSNDFAEMSRKLFYPVAEVSDFVSGQYELRFKALFEEYGIDQTELPRVVAMCKEGNFGSALEYTMNVSGETNLVELSEKLHSYVPGQN